MSETINCIRYRLKNIPGSNMLYKFYDVGGLIAVDRNGLKMKKESNMLISRIFFFLSGGGGGNVGNCT